MPQEKNKGDPAWEKQRGLPMVSREALRHFTLKKQKEKSTRK